MLRGTAGRLQLGVFCTGFALLVLAWVFSTAPYQAPDETAHYLHAASIASGTLLGPQGSTKGGSPEETAWLSSHTHRESIDDRLVPLFMGCTPALGHSVPGHCIVSNYAGDYEPLPFLLPAVGVRLSLGFSRPPHYVNHALRALWIARLASALQSLAFIVLAFALLWRGTAWAVLGLLAALTPSTLFLTSVINGDGLELAANLAFVAGLLRLSHDQLRAPRWVWGGVAVSGAALILAWHLGWVFATVEAGLAVVLLGGKRLADVIRSSRHEALVTAAILLAAMVAFLAWGVGTGLLHSTFGVSPLWHGLQSGISQLRIMAYGAVGLFGMLDVALPNDVYYWIWWGLVLILYLGAMALATQRERVVGALAALIALLFPILLFAWVLRRTGFGLQPRYVMPLFALIPLLSGEFLFRSHYRLPNGLRTYAPSAVISLLACYELVAWWVNARASAGEPSKVWFLASPSWSPPGGWVPWTITAILGAIALLMAAVNEAMASRRPSDSVAATSTQRDKRLLSSPART